MSTVLADRLLQTAIESNMKIGDKLPGEVELADRFHVSRVSIREAINGLKFLGMLDAAPRRDSSVKRVLALSHLRHIVGSVQ